MVVVVKVREVRESSSVLDVVLLLVVGGRVEVAIDEDRKIVVAVAALNKRKRTIKLCD